MQSWLYVAYDPSMNVADDKVDLSMGPATPSECFQGQG
jgi:hypothetical protein